MTDTFAVLVATGHMTEDQAAQAREMADGPAIEHASSVTGRPVGELFAAIVTATLGFAATADLIEERTTPDAVNLLTRERAETMQYIPLRFEEAGLVVAGTLDSVGDVAKQQTLSQLLDGQRIVWLVARDQEVAAKIASAYRNEGEIGELAASAADGSAATALEKRARIVDLYIGQAIRDRASDIHFEPGAREMSVRYRIDGVLVERPAVAKDTGRGVVARIKTMASMDMDTRIPHDGQISFRDGARDVDIRVSTVPTIHGEKAVLRILDNSTRLDLGEFGMSEQVASRWAGAFTRPEGMLLATGPTGSGKSTTLYATLARLNTPERNIVTIENPVEYRLAGINQIQVNANIGLTFAEVLRSVLRQDPNIILVGEIRDKETAHAAIDAAMTGHLVLSTLHANSAAEAYVRLIEMGVEPFLVASVLECALAQRLVRRLCESCRVAITPEQAQREIAATGFTVPDGTPMHLFARNPDGCSRCTDGFRGQLALYEASNRTDAIERYVVSGNVSASQAKAIAVDDGMVPLRQDGWLKVAQGETTFSEILRVTV